MDEFGKQHRWKTVFLDKQTASAIRNHRAAMPQCSRERARSVPVLVSAESGKPSLQPSQRTQEVRACNHTTMKAHVMKLPIRLLVSATAVLFSVGIASAATLVADADVNLRSGPGTQYPVITVIPDGAAVDVRRCDDGWCRVHYGADAGWAKSRLSRPRQWRTGGGDGTILLLCTTGILWPVRLWLWP